MNEHLHLAMNIQQCLTQATQKLTAVTDTPLLDAEILLAEALNKPRSYIYAWPQYQLSKEQGAVFDEYLSRRHQQEPIAYILGVREFWSLALRVTPDTLIPRPETEGLVEHALKLLLKSSMGRIVKVADLGTGCGAIALALASEAPHWQIYATDISDSALTVASNNAQRLALKNVFFYQGHWCKILPCTDMDMIVSNPPYLSEQTL